MKTKLLATLTSSAIALASAASAEVTLQFWDNQQTESGLSQFQQAAVDRFMAENPDIKVEVTTIPYPEYQQRLLTAVQGGNAPDIATLDQIWVAAFAEAGAVADLSEAAAGAGLSRDQFFGGAWDSASYNDGLYGIPFNVDVWQFNFYNKDLLDAAGVSPSDLTTFEGLRAASEKLTGDGKFGIGLFGHRGEDTVVVMNSFIFSNGGAVLDDAGACALNAAPAVEAMEYVQDLAQFAPEGILNANSGNMRELFLNGSLAIEFWPALEQPTLQKSDINWGFVNGTAGASGKGVGTFGGWNLAVFESSAQQEAAWKFIEFMVREDVNGDVVDLIPANKAAAAPFLEANRQGADDIMAHLSNANPRPLSARYLEVADIQMTLYQDVFSGANVQEAADAACADIDALN
ncbi:ABC transporter substrate-binding protein [Actibacterium mucosum]|nr:sugar ABC transporter substrate-binding protein [Actibacterium mucosum]